MVVTWYLDYANLMTEYKGKQPQSTWRYILNTTLSVTAKNLLKAASAKRQLAKRQQN